MTRKIPTPEEQSRREKIRALLQESNITSMEDIQNLFKETIVEFMENGLESELDASICYSFYQVLSAEAYSQHGFNIHGVMFDELHTQPNRTLFEGSGDARMQSLYFLITTAGKDTQSICYWTHQKALDILEGRKHDATFYPVIYGASADEDWTSTAVWKKANPSRGITVGIDKVQAACESAKQNPGEENSCRQLRLNQWVKQSIRWMPMNKWDACAFKVDMDALEGRVCYDGLDLSSTTDITAFVLALLPMDADDKYTVLLNFRIPEDNSVAMLQNLEGMDFTVVPLG